MEPVITVKDVMERYKCSGPTARKYLRKVQRHMENPLSAYERDFKEWESKRMRYTAKLTKKDFEELERKIRFGSAIVPRSRT